MKQVWSYQSIKIGIKIAPHLKIPYNSSQMELFTNLYRPYMDINNAMHIVENESRKTYFYIKNDAIFYFSHINDNVSFFMLDLNKSLYKYIRLYKFKDIIGRGKFFVVGVGSEQQYLILKKTFKTNRIGSPTVMLPEDRIETDRIESIVIFDINSGKAIYTDSVEDLGCEYMNVSGPIANTVMVFIKVTKIGIYITALDIITGETNVLHVGLSEMKNIIMEVADKAEELKDIRDDIAVDNLRYACFVPDSSRTSQATYHHKRSQYSNSYYIYDCGIPLYITLIGQKYEYLFDYLSIYVSLVVNDINCYLSFSYASLTINKLSADEQWSRSVDCDKYVNLRILSSFKLHYYDNINNGYLSNILYSDDCFYVEYDRTGIRINLSIDNSVEYYKWHLYKYKDYLLVMRLKDGIGYYEILAINTQYNVSALYSGLLNDMPYKNETITIGHYYFTSNNKLILLDNNLNYLFVLDLKLVEDFIEEIKSKLQNNPSCISRIYNLHNRKPVLQFVDINKLIKEAVYVYISIRDVKSNIYSYSEPVIDVLSYCIDEGSGNLGIIAEYVVDEVKYIGLFMYEMISDKKKLSLLKYFPDSMPYYIAYCSRGRGGGKCEHNLERTVLHKRNMHISSSKNAGVYRMSNMKGLDIAYKNVGCFAGIMYNRYSLSVLHRLKIEPTISYLDSIIIAKYLCLPAIQSCYTVFIVAWLSLVKKAHSIVI
jgi:hypothetical protein